MKIAISAKTGTVESLIDQRFGRGRYFLLIDNDKFIMAIENQGAIQGHGAGIRAAQQLGELGIKAVITGNLGPNAANVLGQLGIKTYHASGMAKDAIERFYNNGLKEITDIAKPHSGIVKEKVKYNERIFFPLLEDNGLDSQISAHFGHAPFFGLYDTSTKYFTITDNTLSHTDPDKSPVDQIIEAVSPTTVFAHGIGARAIMLFKQKGIALKTGPYKTVNEVIANLDKLEEQASDCGHNH